MRHHVDGGLAADAALLRQQHAFRKREHLHRQAQVDRDLHRQREAVVADVRHARADVVEQRLGAIERAFLAADHDRELALLQGDDAARHRRVDHLGALAADFRRQRPAHRRADRAHVDEQLTSAQTGEQSVWAVGDRFERGRVGDHHEGGVRGGGDRARRVAPLHALVEEPLRLGFGAVVAGDVMALGHEAIRHQAAHRTETDVSEICHMSLSLPQGYTVADVNDESFPGQRTS